MSTELTPSSGSLTIRPDQTAFTPEQAAVLQQFGIDNDVTPAELSGFLHLCQRTGLDPFSRQIYLIGRKDRKLNRKVFTPQTGIDGYRVIAQRVSLQSGGTYGYEDVLWCGEDGRWVDVWLSPGPPAAAKVTVLRNGLRFSAVALYSEYAQRFPDGNPKALWATMPSGQTAKCAEALALRKAFPHDLAGVYTAEEMAQADNPEPERHLRSVQPGEADPWATAAPAAPAAPARDFVAEAHAAATADEVRQIYRDAAAAGFGPGTATLQEIAEVGKAKAASPAAPAPADTVTDAEFADPVAEAEQQLRATAARVGLDTLDADFQQSYGLPIAEAGVQQLVEMNQLLGGAA
ncbi:phage recombination protein Bet [Streptomyces virginiae]|uniref:phage recombination protein Bet n=1 Tax=Streptomyces virginiae TaxID=1961 RepID=UPI00344553E1